MSDSDDSAMDDLVSASPVPDDLAPPSRKRPAPAASNDDGSPCEPMDSDAASESGESESDDELAVLNARCVRLEADKQQLQQRVRYLETLAKVRKTSDECPFRLEVWMPPGWETAPSGHKFPSIKGTVGTFPHQVREMAPTTGEEGASTQRVYLIEEQRKMVNLRFVLKNTTTNTAATASQLCAWAKIPDTNSIAFRLDVVEARPGADGSYEVVERGSAAASEYGLFANAKFDAKHPELVMIGDTVDFTFMAKFKSGGMTKATQTQFRFRATCSHPGLAGWVDNLTALTTSFAAVSRVVEPKARAA